MGLPPWRLFAAGRLTQGQIIQTQHGVRTGEIALGAGGGAGRDQAIDQGHIHVPVP